MERIIINCSFYWNNEPEEILEQECYVGVYDENKPEIDSFYWFSSISEIIGDHGNFTVVDFEIVDANAKYVVLDTQACYFMADTIEDPMSKEDLIDRFWYLDEARTNKKEDFTFDYIRETWNLEIIDSRIYKLREYDDYMISKLKSEGYALPVSLDCFLGLQVIPVPSLEELNLENKEHFLLFERIKNMYLKNSVEVMDGTELTNAPVCYKEWLEYEGSGAEVASEEV